MLGRGMRRKCWLEEQRLGVAASSGLGRDPAVSRALCHLVLGLITWAPGTKVSPRGRHAASMAVPGDLPH